MDTKLDNFPLSFHTLGRRIFNSSDEDDAASLASFSTITTTTPADTSSEAESSKVKAREQISRKLLSRLSNAFSLSTPKIRLDSRLFVSSGGTID